ncbi:MAG: YlbF family regulator [Clostridia bacterium]|nr:YlbF family regulator [Clostridia bacterium]
MDVIKITRELGKAIQADERYLEYMAAKRANDDDEELQELIGRLNIIQLSYQNENEKEAPDKAKLDQWNDDFSKLYSDIMLHPKMREFEDKKQVVDDLMSYIVNILSLCVNGADPETAEPVQSDGSGCTGSCSTCGGCG